MGTRARSRGRSRRRVVLALSASSFLALATGELAARALFGVPMRERLPVLQVRANEFRGYEMVPGVEHYTYEHPVRVNALGLRGPELAEKAPGEVRILCLGDSTTYGQGVADEDTLPGLCERELAGTGNVHVVNGGVRGYGTREELGMLRELGRRIAPDVVVLLWYPNDLERPEVEENRRKLELSGPVAFDTGTRLEGSGLLLWRLRQLARRSALLVKCRHALADLTAHRLTPAEIDQGFARLDEDLRAFEAIVRDLGARMVVAVIPTGAAAAGEGPEDVLHERVGALARAHGFEFVDLTPDLRAVREASGRLPVLPYDGHYTGAGNRAMAAHLARVLACPATKSR